MKTQRFIIGTNAMDAAETKSFSKALETLGKIAWWHWVDGLWLLVSKDEEITTVQIRDLLRGIYSGHTIILEINEPCAFSGFGNNEAADWIRNFWMEKKDDLTTPDSK